MCGHGVLEAHSAFLFFQRLLLIVDEASTFQAIGWISTVDPRVTDVSVYMLPRRQPDFLPYLL